MTKIQMFQTVAVAVLAVVNTVLFLVFCHLKFEFVLDFGIRISNFALSSTQVMSSVLSSHPGHCFRII